MNKIRKNAKKEILEYANIGEFPKELDEKDDRIWARAIALVKKSNGFCDYCIVDRGINSLHITKTIGDLYPIMETIALYPYMFVDESYIPNIATEKDVIEYLKAKGYDDKQQKKFAKDQKKKLLFYEIAKEYLDSFNNSEDEEEEDD